MPQKPNLGIKSIAHEEHDYNEYRKRVATYADGNSVSYEDTSFVTGDSPAVLDVYTDLGRNGHDGYISNDGSGNFRVEISTDGTNYGGLHTLKNGEILELAGLKKRKKRITWVADSSYRAFIV